MVMSSEALGHAYESLEIDESLGLVTRVVDRGGTTVLSDLTVSSVDQGFPSSSTPRPAVELSIAYLSECLDEQLGLTRIAASLAVELFGYVIYTEVGPSDLDRDQALHWARSRASRVRLELAEDHEARAFSAGVDAIEGLPRWSGDVW